MQPLERARGDAPHVAAEDVLLRQEVLVADLAEVEHRDDVRVDQRRAELGLVDELRHHRRIARQLGAQPLDDEGAAEALGAERHRGEHLRHPPFAEQIEQQVAAEGGGPAGAGDRARRRRGSRWRRRPARRACRAPSSRAVAPSDRRGPGACGRPASRDAVSGRPSGESAARTAVGVARRGLACAGARRPSPPSASTPATDQMAAVVASRRALGVVRGGRAAAERPEPEPGDDRADRRGPGPAGCPARRDWKIGPRPSAPIAACSSSRSGSAPASSTACVPSESSTAPRAFSASLRIAASSIGLASSSTAGICLSGQIDVGRRRGERPPFAHHDLRRPPRAPRAPGG